jgi:hypothetical protein
MATNDEGTEPRPRDGVAVDAVPITAEWPVGADDEGDPWPALPTWYMPEPAARLLSGWRARVVVGIVAALFLIELAGLCATYGPL